MTKRNFLPYGKPIINDRDVQAVTEALRSDWLTTGPRVSEFETAVARFTGASGAVAVSSGTAALHCAYHALGLGPGDEVIVPTLTFVATAAMVFHLGAKPVLVDVNENTGLIDVKEVERHITPATKAVVAVDYAGQPCSYAELHELCRKRDIALVADACHSLGASYRGTKVGKLADLTCLSFHPVKHITTGEGGMIVSDHSDYLAAMRRFRNHGISDDGRTRSQNAMHSYSVENFGFNYRLTDFQCALGLSQMETLDERVESRRKLARCYREALESFEGLQLLHDNSDVHHSYHLFVVKCLERDGESVRDRMFQELRDAGIGVNVHYIPVHLHKAFKMMPKGGEVRCPSAERMYRTILSLPLFHTMTERDVARVVEELRRALRK